MFCENGDWTVKLQYLMLEFYEKKTPRNASNASNLKLTLAKSNPELIWTFALPTFPGVEEAVHLHAGARVGHTEHRAGN